MTISPCRLMQLSPCSCQKPLMIPVTIPGGRFAKFQVCPLSCSCTSAAEVMEQMRRSEAEVPDRVMLLRGPGYDLTQRAALFLRNSEVSFQADCQTADVSQEHACLLLLQPLAAGLLLCCLHAFECSRVASCTFEACQQTVETQAEPRSACTGCTLCMRDCWAAFLPSSLHHAFLVAATQSALLPASAWPGVSLLQPAFFTWLRILLVLTAQHLLACSAGGALQWTRTKQAAGSFVM